MANDKNYSEVTPEIERLAEMCQAQVIPNELYGEYKVYRGLRDLDGNGVLTGLTNIAHVTAKKVVDGKEVPVEGNLYYQGVNIQDIVNGCVREDRYGYEETVYLLLFGNLPNQGELSEFTKLLSSYRSLPSKFTRDVIMKAPSNDMMNTLARSVLTLYYYDDNPDDTSTPNVLRQCLKLIAQFPLLAVYGYQAYNHYERDQSLIIHQPNPELSTAENILYLLRPDQKYTKLEARILDLSLILHAEHGGGNNSTFATHVVSSSGTDTYSSVAASLGSLKGPRHGGANIRVMGMIEDLKQHVTDWRDERQIEEYLVKLIHKQAYDKAGLIYGIGHAIYSLSDPRALIFESFVKKLSEEKGRQEEYDLYAAVARIAPQVIAKERKMYKGVSANVDFYSGFVYDMLKLPVELYTPIFGVSRIAGWSAHRIEELINGGKIIRPAYRSVSAFKEYVPLAERK